LALNLQALKRLPEQEKSSDVRYPKLTALQEGARLAAAGRKSDWTAKVSHYNSKLPANLLLCSTVLSLAMENDGAASSLGS
jgi:hypothetical protein